MWVTSRSVYAEHWRKAPVHALVATLPVPAVAADARVATSVKSNPDTSRVLVILQRRLVHSISSREPDCCRIQEHAQSVQDVVAWFPLTARIPDAVQRKEGATATRRGSDCRDCRTLLTKGTNICVDLTVPRFFVCVSGVQDGGSSWAAAVAGRRVLQLRMRCQRGWNMRHYRYSSPHRPQSTICLAPILPLCGDLWVIQNA